MTNKHIFTAALAAGLTLSFATAISAQQTATPDTDNGNHIVVPLSHPSQAATLKVSSLNGSITVHSYSGNSIVIDASGGGARRHRDRNPPEEAQGMRLLNGSGGLEATEDNNTVTVHTSELGGSENLSIQVPANTSVNIRTVNGSRIEVDGVTGDVNVDATNGSITLANDSGSVVAHALNGRILATLLHLDANKPSSFSSMNGALDITLPSDVHADLQLKTNYGNIYMDDGFNFQQSHTAATPSGEREEDGMYRIRVDNTISGALNGGGPQLRVTNFNGNIYIRKAK